MDTFAKRLRFFMDRASINQTELSRRTNIGKSSISEYLAGSYVPKQKKTYLLAEALGIKPSQLMGLEDMPKEYEKTALDYENGLDEQEVQLLNLLKQLSPEQKEFLLVQLEALVKRNKGSEETPF